MLSQAASPPLRPSVRVGPWVLRQGGPWYAATNMALVLALLTAFAAAMPRTLTLAGILLRLQYGPWMMLVLPGALLPLIAAHEATHIAVFRLAHLPIRIRVGGRLLAVRVEVPVAVPRRVALAAALAPQPVVLGTLAALTHGFPSQWPLWLFCTVLLVAGSAGDFLSAVALALSRDVAVVLR